MRLECRRSSLLSCLPANDVVMFPVKAAAYAGVLNGTILRQTGTSQGENGCKADVWQQPCPADTACAGVDGLSHDSALEQICCVLLQPCAPLA